MTVRGDPRFLIGFVQICTVAGLLRGRATGLLKGVL